jgi:hypothetical protein
VRVLRPSALLDERWNDGWPKYRCEPPRCAFKLILKGKVVSLKLRTLMPDRRLVLAGPPTRLDTGLMARLSLDVDLLQWAQRNPYGGG